jgi:hypothetical protein
MDDKKITVEELKAALAGDMNLLFAEVAKAMNQAQPGRIIADSEEPVRDANAHFRQVLYQKAINLLQDKQEAFPPSADSTEKMEE